MQILRITDGQTEVSFLSGDYHLLSWSPSVAKRADNLLEPSPFQSVTERMTIAVTDYEKMQTLAQLLDQAQQWRQGRNTRPVRLEYQLTVSSAVLVALVIGVSGSMIGLPPIYSLSAATGLVDPVTIEFERQGQWLTPDQTNLITNGSMEDWTAGVPDSWDLITLASVTERNDIVHDGLSAVELTASTGLSNGISQDITLPGTGVDFTLSAWVYVVSASTKAKMLVSTTSGFGEVYSTKVGEWERLEISGISPAESGTVQFKSGLGSCTFIVDQVLLTVSNVSGEAGDIATATAVDNGDLASLNFATGQEKYPSPTKITLTDFLIGSRHPRSFLIATNGTGQITIVDDADFTYSSPFAEVTDTTHYARNDTVVRLTPAATTAYRLQVSDYTLAFYNVKRVGIFANVRNNSSTTSFAMQAVSFAPGGTFYTRPIVVRADATASPEWVYLGAVTSNRDGTFFIDITASAASGTVDIDTVVLVNLDDEPAIVSVDQGENTGTSTAVGLVVNHHTLTEQSPKVEVIIDGTAVTGWSARGKIAIYTDAPEIEAVLLATGGDTSVDHWRQVTSAAVIANDWTASRLPGRLVAE